jgi:hypothetical protein
VLGLQKVKYCNRILFPGRQEGGGLKLNLPKFRESVSLRANKPAMRAS